jgi:hypothetical protein
MAESTMPLAALTSVLSVREVQKRLEMIFPEEFPDRGILVGTMAARVIFVFLYGGFIEDAGRYLRPSYIYLFTSKQATMRSERDRHEWLIKVKRSGYRATGKRWYADTTKEPIRDDLMRHQLFRLGIMQKLPGYSPVASVPVNYLSRDFAELFNPSLVGEALTTAIKRWYALHLDLATRQRMALRAEGI